MNRVLEELFATYGESIMQKLELYEEADVTAALDKLPMDQSTKVKVCDLLLDYYSLWSTAAFAIGLQLGLSLTGRPGSKARAAGSVPQVPHYDHRRQNDGTQCQGHIVPALVLQHMELGSALAAVVAAALHGRGQLVGPPEGADEQRHQNGNQGLGLLDQAATLKVRAPGLLGRHDLVRLLDQRGNEPQGDGHHHGQLMDRHMEPLHPVQ